MKHEEGPDAAIFIFHVFMFHSSVAHRYHSAMHHDHSHVLAEQTHAFIRSQTWDTAVLPFGATEPHNFHMPYGTDNFQVEEIGRRACGIAYKQGAKVLLLPAVPF